MRDLSIIRSGWRVVRAVLEQRCSMVQREDTEQEEDEWNNNSHPSLSSWCEGNVDESSVVLCPLPCFVSSDLIHLCG